MQAQTPAYQGYYINLDRSEERRKRIEDGLARHSLSGLYRRFPAVEGRSLPKGQSPLSPGQLGCFHSHVWLLKEAQSRGLHAHILEDDAILSEHTEPVITDAIQQRLFDHFDIVFTDTFVDCDLALLKGMKEAFDKTNGIASRPLRIADFQIMDLSRRNFACTTSYVAGFRSLDRILALFRQELAVGPRTPIDLFIRDQVHAGKLRAACIFPFVTSLALEDIVGSMIDERSERLEKPSVMMFAALRYSFFLGRDLSHAKHEMDAVIKTRRSPADPHHELIVQAVDYVISPDFEGF